MRILIIEDEENFAELLAAHFRKMDCEVVIVNNWKDASDQLTGVKLHDIITLDLNLPDSLRPDTLKKVDEIRKTNPDALLLIVSGVLCEGDAKMADGCISKDDPALKTSGGFWSLVSDVVASALSLPSRYKRSLTTLEGIAERLISVRNPPLNQPPHK